MFVGDLLFKGDQHLTHDFLQIEVHLLFLGDVLVLELGDIQHAAHQTAEPLGFVRDDLQIVAVAVFRNGAVQNAVHIAGNGGHGGLQLVGHVGHEFLALVFAFLKTGGHVVEGQSQFLHFLTGGLVHPDPGGQVAVAEGVGGLCHVLQGFALPAGEEAGNHNSQQHHKGRGGQEQVGDPVQDLSGGDHRGGDNDDAAGGAAADNGQAHHIPGVLVKALDNAGGHISAVLQHFCHVGAVNVPADVLAEIGIAGADDDLALLIADHCVKAGDLGGNVQIQHKFPAVQAAVNGVGSRQIRQDLSILLQTLDGVVRHVVIDEHLKGGAQQNQGQKQYGRNGKKAAAKGTFHPYSTSNL